jgi:hypothetical protein
MYNAELAQGELNTTVIGPVGAVVALDQQDVIAHLAQHHEPQALFLAHPVHVRSRCIA